MLTILSKDYVASPVSASGELGITRERGNDSLRFAGRTKIASLIRETNYRRRICDVYKAGLPTG